MDPNIPSQKPSDPSQYFYPYENGSSQKMSIYKNKFEYYAFKAWPYIQNIFAFLFFHIKRTIGGIITIAKGQIKSD